MTPSDDARKPSQDTPYAGLTPELVLDALDGVGFRGDGRLLQLNSYENRVFQVFLEDGSVVVAKFYRPGRWSDAQILEEHSFAVELASSEIPVVAPLQLAPTEDSRLKVSVNGATLAQADTSSERFRFSVSPRRSGHGPELDDDATLARMGRFIGRMHAVGRRSNFMHRRDFSVQTIGMASRDWLAEHRTVPDELESAWQTTVDAALAAATRLFDECTELRPLRLHGDCHPGNVLWTDDGPHFVDLDDAATGPAMQDLWMLLSGDRAAMARQLAVPLSGYDAFAEFNRHELRLVEALRTLRMIHHSAWLAQRWSDPAFPAAFPWFASSSYWSQQISQLREQLEAMAQPPLSLPSRR